jgi:hypothetical protein
MTVKKLRELLTDLPDDMQILIPAEPTVGFTGAFFSPCSEDSGVTELGTTDLSEEEMQEMELLGQEIPHDKAFVFVPCGFLQEHDDTHLLN